ncbi:MAG: hypothetical protein K1000chlam4_01045, partial [Chlamydiae bacterium]|nr:hypothetical protein [Chlamydiota bacterium]
MIRLIAKELLPIKSTKISKEELKQTIERDLKYDIGGTFVSVIICLVCVYYFNIAFFMFFILMALIFYNSYLITKR